MIVIKSAIINIMYVIWKARNNARFNNRQTHWKSAIVWITSNTALARNKSNLGSSSSSSSFTILKSFNVIIHSPKAPIIKKVIWRPRIDHWLKYNNDDVATSISSECRGIFKNSQAKLICCFVENTSLESTFYVELGGAMRAIEIAASNNWSKLWLETDSIMFKLLSLLIWCLGDKETSGSIASLCLEI
jgi:hypothetical protein